MSVYARPNARIMQSPFVFIGRIRVVNGGALLFSCIGLSSQMPGKNAGRKCYGISVSFCFSTMITVMLCLIDCYGYGFAGDLYSTRFDAMK